MDHMRVYAEANFWGVPQSGGHFNNRNSGVQPKRCRQVTQVIHARQHVVADFALFPRVLPGPRHPDVTDLLTTAGEHPAALTVTDALQQQHDQFGRDRNGAPLRR